MFNRKFLVFICTLSIMFIIAGCGSDDAKKSGDEVTISLWNNNDAGRTYYPKLIEEFEKEHDNIKVELTNLTADTEDAVVQTAISDNDLPDIFNQNAYSIDELVDLDLVKELDEIFTDEVQEKYVEGIFDEGNASYKDNVYLFPKFKGSVYIMFYNKNVLDEYGIEETPKTWDDLVEIGEKIYDESGGSTYGLIFGGESGWLLSDFSRLMATELSPETGLDYHSGEYKFATEGYFETMKFFKEMLDNNIISPTSIEVINEVALEYFANGEAAFLIDGNWTGQLLDNFGFNDWGVIPIPTKEEDGKHFMELAIGSNDGLYVSKDTEHWEEVKTFLEFLEENIYEEMLKLGVAVIAQDISNFEDVDLPFDQLMDISKLFDEINVTGPDPFIVNSETMDVTLELRKNLPDTSPGLIFSGYLTDQIDDLEAELQKYEDEYNEAFDNALEKVEGASREDFTFPNWVPYENYTEEMYEELD